MAEDNQLPCTCNDWNEEGDWCPRHGERKAALAPLPAGVAAASSGVGRYLTTAHSCQCPDRKFRGRACKHMEAFRILFCEE